MVLGNIQHILETWAPKHIAWDRDNVGLQIGSARKHVRRILVTLDVTDAVVSEARKKNADVIISHHPLIFHPMRAVDSEDDRVGRIVSNLIQSDIALYVIHTNLDFTHHGVSFSLAERLALRSVEVLHRHQHVHKKIVVFVPEDHVEKLIAVMAEEGAGIIGKYERCSFRTRGVGTFKPGQGARPYAGAIGKIESAEEERLEMIAPAWNIQRILNAMRAAHPYDEVAYDVYDLANASDHFGAGAIGELQTSMPLETFLTHVKKRLKVGVLRYASNARRTIKRVAVCGGSGSDLLPIAIQRGADAFVTADIRYHTFQDSDKKIALIDAGHYETERPALRSVVNYLQKHCVSRKERIKIFTSGIVTNFVQYSLA